MNKNKLCSAIIIAKNEEPRIGACLASLAWADEIIVIDNGSTDKTNEICRKAHAEVIHCETTDFSELRNIGAKQACGKWLLYVDADEVLPNELVSEITALLRKENEHTAYFIKRRNYYLGHIWPTSDRMIRLIRRDSLVSWEGTLHEHPSVNGSIGQLNHMLVHTTHRTLADMVDKTNIWSETEAELRFRSGHPPIAAWRIIRVMLTAFWDSYVLQKGYRAGTIGLIESIYQSFSMFITYAKLWEAQNKLRLKRS